MVNGRVIIFLIKFFLIGALFIVSNHHLALADSGNRDIFFDKYYSWISTTLDNTYLIVGDAVKLEWLPESGNFSIPNK